jgi:DNA-binding LacI/PurR family transcriptional regulator
MRAMSRRGIAVGEEVSVVGWDNINSARTCWPGLTTVDHRFAEMGHAAGKLALRMISGDSKIRQTLAGHREVVEPRLVVRESTAPAK